ncbi:hypothetical protein E8D34_16940 [Nocardioides sp. GY 10113]|uniref:hypothetical protein n=1 Tax=Nocardioides sp. GY 10113 TaxID=2569761 RepID=UPI0010A84E13|nr:hypothetical protein [Nocardioides sp. GY 10113]TIC82503.1 hypothetical protein E8D34_16940 [Nocardioides sp. GY 10113]
MTREKGSRRRRLVAVAVVGCASALLAAILVPSTSAGWSTATVTNAAADGVTATSVVSTKGPGPVPPAYVNCDDDTYFARVEISWPAPVPSTDVVGYRMYIWKTPYSTPSVLNFKGVGNRSIIFTSSTAPSGSFYGTTSEHTGSDGVSNGPSFKGAGVSVRSLYGNPDDMTLATTRRNGWRQRWPSPSRTMYPLPVYGYPECSETTVAPAFYAWDPNDYGMWRVPLDLD